MNNQVTNIVVFKHSISQVNASETGKDQLHYLDKMVITDLSY